MPCRSLRGPFPECRPDSDGGVNASNAADYIAAGAALGRGRGSGECSRLARAGNLAKITQAARELVQAVHAARELALERASLPFQAPPCFLGETGAICGAML